jgi:hypothetical protein
MALKTDLTGMLTEGLFQPTQEPIPSSYRESVLRSVQRAGEGVRRGVGALTGADTMTTRERANKAMQGLDINNPADQPKILEVVRKYAPEREAALVAQFAQQGRVRAEKQAITAQQEAERSSLADFLELEYGDKGGRLRPAVMSGAITAGNVDKFVAKEEKEKRTLKNITYTDTAGNTQTQMVQFNEQGDAFSETGQPLTLPDDAQLTITGRTPEDVKSGVSEFTDKEFRAVRDDIINSRGKLKVLEGITDESIDKYLSFLGKGLAGTGRTLSSFSGLGGDALNDFIKNRTGLDLQEFAGEQGLLFGDLENYFNQKRHDITGAAAAISELRELRKGILSGETSPAVAKAKIAQILQRERDSQEMNFTLLKQNGLDISGYFDKDGTRSIAPVQDNSNMTVAQQEAKATADRILAAAKAAQE